jgi:hypothetical protein
VNRLGNMTLLSSRLNTAIKNADFATKKAKGYTDSDIAMTRELLEIDVWDQAAVDARQRELSRWIFDIWSFPGEVRPELLDAVEGPAAAAPPDTETDALDQLPETPA